MPRIGALVFGVGRADERAAIGGISHLVEHLALAPLTQQAYGHNGLVAGRHAVLFATGTEEELVEYFGTVTRALGALPLDRLGMERRILRQEARNRSSGVTGTLLWQRYGNRGYGQLGVEELGLDWLGPDPVAEWSAGQFTRQNAALWLSGPPPADLRLELPDGPAIDRTVSLDPIPDLTFPAHLPWKLDRVSMSYLTERSAAAVVTLATIARRAREILRFERGLVYDVGTDYERVGPTIAHCVVSADCRAEDAAIVRQELLAAVDAIARDGLTEDEVRVAVRQFNDGRHIPQHAFGFLDGIAFDQVVGRELETPDQIIAEYDALDGAVAGAEFARSLPTLLLSAPGQLPDDRFTSYPEWSAEAVTGRRFEPPGFRLPGRKPVQTLVVGDEGVTWTSSAGGQLTVRFDRCVAIRHWQGDVRELWGEDGFRVRVLPAEWSKGTEATKLVDAAVPAEAIACDEHGVGAYEDPADHQAAAEATSS
jgi:hypothetical protein